MMRAAVVLLLLGYAGLVATVGRALLARARWVTAAPLVGVALWLGMVVSVVLSVLQAGLIATLPHVLVSTDPHVVRAGLAMSIRAQYSTPAGAFIGTVGAAVVGGTLMRIVWTAMLKRLRTVSSRARQEDALTLVARPGPAPRSLVVEDDRPAVYCLPGQRRTVLTTAALRRLDRRQLHAVLGHEQAHLSQRHHLVLTLAELLETAFGRVGLFAAAHAEIARLVEMAADDAAIRHSDRLTLASALLTLASGRAPAPALGAGGTTAAQRIRRLIESPRPARNSAEAAIAVVGRASGLATAVGLIAVPAMAVSVVVSCCC
jgi:Zn-dependent protease with chaperone function